LTVFSGCAGLLIGFADRLIDEEILSESSHPVGQDRYDDR
jgi:hypothetical protein